MLVERVSNKITYGVGPCANCNALDLGVRTNRGGQASQRRETQAIFQGEGSVLSSVSDDAALSIPVVRIRYSTNMSKSRTSVTLFCVIGVPLDGDAGDADYCLKRHPVF